MLRRRTLTWLTVVLLALVAIGVGIYLCLPRPPRFTEDQFDRIKAGMTQAEVEAVLGCRPGNYAGADWRVLLEIEIKDFSTRELLYTSQDWMVDKPGLPYIDPAGQTRQDAIGIRVWFDTDNRVADKKLIEVAYTGSTLLERLHAWVGW